MKGNVERTSAQIENHNVLFCLQIEEVGRDFTIFLHAHEIVNDCFGFIQEDIVGIIHVKSGGSRGIDGCLALIRIEGGRDGNDNIVQVRLMQNLLGLVHQISQNLRGYVRRSFIFNFACKRNRFGTTHQ